MANTYYKHQIGKLLLPTNGATLTFKVVSAIGEDRQETNWLGLNQESALELINYLSANILSDSDKIQVSNLLTEGLITWSGSDVDLETSLFEYGVIMQDQYNKDGSGNQLVIYKISEDAYGCGHVSEAETNGYLLGEEFPKPEDIKRFLSFYDTTLSKWLTTSHVNKLQDIIGYWGHENIMGTSYASMTKAEVINLHLNPQVIDGRPVYDLLAKGSKAQDEDREAFERWKLKQPDTIVTDTKHPTLDVSVGDKVNVISGHNNQLRYITEVLGFDAQGKAYMLWDCYWFGIDLVERKYI
jgi:hypothetical protein